MAKGDRNVFRLFTRSRRDHKSKVKPTKVHGVAGRITDALGATRAMQPTVVLPTNGEGERRRPELTIIRPPPPPPAPSVSLRQQRIRFSVSYLAGATLVLAVCMLLLMSFVLGMRYQSGRQGALAVRGPQSEADGSPAPGSGAVRTDGGEGTRPPLVGITGDGAATAAPRYRLRIGVYSTAERDSAEASLATLRAKGVPVVLETRQISGYRRLVIYSEKQFASRTSPEANDLLQLVRQIKQNGRYDFASAYYVVVD